MTERTLSVNELMSKATDLITNAELQIKTLNNSKSIGVHLSKEIKEFNQVVHDLLIAGAKEMELEAIIGKYLTYVGFVNSEEALADEKKLEIYPVYRAVKAAIKK